MLLERQCLVDSKNPRIRKSMSKSFQKEKYFHISNSGYRFEITLDKRVNDNYAYSSPGGQNDILVRSDIQAFGWKSSTAELRIPTREALDWLIVELQALRNEVRYRIEPTVKDFIEERNLKNSADYSYRYMLQMITPWYYNQTRGQDTFLKLYIDLKSAFDEYKDNEYMLVRENSSSCHEHEEDSNEVSSDCRGPNEVEKQVYELYLKNLTKKEIDAIKKFEANNKNLLAEKNKLWKNHSLMSRKEYREKDDIIEKEFESRMYQFFKIVNKEIANDYKNELEFTKNKKKFLAQNNQSSS